MRGLSFSMECRILTGVPFLPKMVYKWVWFRSLSGASTYKTMLGTTPPPALPGRVIGNLNLLLALIRIGSREYMLKCKTFVITLILECFPFQLIYLLSVSINPMPLVILFIVSISVQYK